jgi:hypothetical protein
MNRKLLPLAGMLALLAGLLTPFTGYAQPARQTLTFSNPAFANVWNRADSLVNSGAATRSWLWGNGFTIAGVEPYKQSPGNVRTVQYFDKARMEINQPGAPHDRFYVTNGLLVRELISGRVALGDSEFEQRSPANNVAIAGDPIETNSNAPTYASFTNLASLNNDKAVPSAIGQYATRTITKDGSTSSNPALAGVYSGLKYVYYDTHLGHNIPEVFWNFMNSRGSVLGSNGSIVQDAIMDWVKDLGFPLTEAYWTRAKVGGVERDVMVQAFERRVLTYTPSNDPAYRVEMGNVGLHYFNWRYRGGQQITDASVTQYPLLKGPHAAPGINAEIFGHTGQIPGWMNDLGLHWIRQQVRWDSFEPSKGQFMWEALDGVVNTMNAQGYHIMLSVVRAPAWANPSGGMALNPQDFADFVTALAIRYKGKVAAYEMWNEQNLASEAGKPIQIGRYVQILKAGYYAVKQVDQLAVVVAGGLSPVGFTDINNVMDDAQYLRQFYAYNNGEAKRYFDVLGAHPGSNNNPPDTLWPGQPGPGPGWTNDPSFYFRRIEQLRQIMVDNGDGNKQMWLTEFGWDSTPTPPPGYEYAKQISEEQQAQYIARAFQKGYYDYPWMGVMMLWQLNFALPSVTANPDDEKNGWGIVRRDGSPRPSYYAVQSYARSWR